MKGEETDYSFQKRDIKSPRKKQEKEILKFRIMPGYLRDIYIMTERIRCCEKGA
jgi:hypothetical protein